METVLITGAYGFLGRYVARHYSGLGHYVVGIGHGSWSRAEWQQWGLAEWHTADITTESLVTYSGKPDVIIHCAGSGSVAFSVAQPQLDFGRTVAATSQVLEFMRLHVPHARLIYPSSAAVYGAAPVVPTSEESATHPVSPYGVHKLMAENLGAMYANNFKLTIKAIRFFSVYGQELRKQLLWDACSKRLRGVTEFPGTGQETRDWIHVSDAVKLIEILSKATTTDYEIINGGTGTSVSVKDVLLELSANLNVGTPLGFTGQSRPGDPLHLVAQPSRAQGLGWYPQVSWQKGFADYVGWYQTTCL